MVHEPKAFERFAIICLEKDVQNAHYINDKFYNLCFPQRPSCI